MPSAAPKTLLVTLPNNNNNNNKKKKKKNTIANPGPGKKQQRVFIDKPKGVFACEECTRMYDPKGFISVKCKSCDNAIFFSKLADRNLYLNSSV
jgi:hypothetical protein